ncbi:MAG: thiamine pyrophosphate-binding protein [Synergistaceae bacterium]|jgi:acetolactate synthase-1/2/3 large subunit|nr:thiamine pyrophosphate-binding protein [Synergistaceae bacterium]
MNAAKTLLEMLSRYGVTDVFGLPGETTLALYREWDAYPGVAYHMCRDERSSVFMVDAYAKATGRVGICEGPSVGATHMIPGVTEAFAACVPILVFTSDVALDTTKKNMLTGFDQTAIFRGVTKETYTVTKGAEIPFLIRRAFRSAAGGRPGPVHIRIPHDIFGHEVDESEIFAQERFASFPGVRSSAAEEDMRAAAEEITSASRPVMICGQGCIHSGAWEAVLELAERVGMPVGSTINAKGIFPETHELSLGVVGARGGLEWSNGMAASSDLVLFVGTSTDSALTDGWKLPDPKSSLKIIQIDISELELGNNYRVLPLMGDARETINGILKFIPADLRDGTREWMKRAKRERGEYEKRLNEFERSLGDAPHPLAIVRILERAAPDDAFFVFDPGISAVYPASFLRLGRSGRRTAFNFAMGALGYGIPAAIGAKIGLPDRKVIGLIGDGSFGFAAGELETAVRLGLDIMYILFDNRSYGWIRGTEFVTGKSPLSPDFGRFTNFAEVDYVKIAEGFGMKGFSTGSAKEFEEILRRCLAESGAKLIAITSRPEDKLLPPVPGWYRYAKSVGLENLYGSACMTVR